MNEKTNDKLENNNSMEQQENVDEKLIKKIDQEKGKKIKIIFDEDSSENNETSGEESNSENNETASEEDNLETLDSLKKELSENKDKLLRSLAESENTRKQMEKIRIETNKYGVQPLAEKY